MSTNDFFGMDYEWVAIDEDGHVGVFTSAGAGPIPRWVADDQAWWEAMLDIVNSLPARGTFQLEVPDEHDLTDWKRWAAVGLFAYDWLDVHRSTAASSGLYELIATPTEPIKIEALATPEPPRDRRILSGVCFARTRRVDVKPFG